jgi:hypothetical protein
MDISVCFHCTSRISSHVQFLNCGLNTLQCDLIRNNNPLNKLFTKEIIGNLLVLSDARLGERHCLFEGPVGRIESTLRRATCMPVVLDFRVDELEFLLQMLSHRSQAKPSVLPLTAGLRDAWGVMVNIVIFQVSLLHVTYLLLEQFLPLASLEIR